MRNFYAELNVQGQIASNPASQLRRPPARRKSNANRPSAEVMLPLLPATEVPSVQLIRDLAILSLSAYERLRIGEIARLNVSDVDLKAGMVRVATRPTRKAVVFLSQTTSQLLSRWLAARRLVAAGQDEAVFISLHWTSGRSAPGTRISTRGLSQILRAHQARRRS
jgi:site-specific recombinase XerC